MMQVGESNEEGYALRCQVVLLQALVEVKRLGRKEDFQERVQRFFEVLLISCYAHFGVCNFIKYLRMY